MARQIVFISCGQRHEHERKLGNQLCEVVTDCGYEPFFAQRHSDLRGLSEAIFDTLDEAAAYIAVLHRREKFSESEAHRASLFIEQELAIAAFIRRRRREVPVLFYVQSGVERDGVRSTLLLNASFPDRRDFEENDEVIEHVRSALPALSVSTAVLPGPNMRLEVRPSWATDGSSTIKLEVVARNQGTAIPQSAELSIFVPRDFNFAINAPGRRGPDSTGNFEVIERHPAADAFSLDPEKARVMYTLQVPMMRGLSEKVFRFRFVAEGQLPQELRPTYGDLWKAADAGNTIT